MRNPAAADVTEKQPKPELITIAIPNDANVLPKTKVVNFLNTQSPSIYYLLKIYYKISIFIFQDTF